MILKDAGIWHLESHNCFSAMSHSRGSASFNGVQFLLRGPWKLSLFPFKKTITPRPTPLLQAQIVDLSLYMTKYDFEKFKFSSFI